MSDLPGTRRRLRFNDPAPAVDAVIRGAGPVGWPRSAEVVTMQPPDRLIATGIPALPTLGDGRQSGTSDSPSILNASPESAVGGGLAPMRTGDVIRFDFGAGTCNLLVPPEEFAHRRAEPAPPIPESQTPWQADLPPHGLPVVGRRRERGADGIPGQGADPAKAHSLRTEPDDENASLRRALAGPDRTARRFASLTAWPGRGRSEPEAACHCGRPLPGQADRHDTRRYSTAGQDMLTALGPLPGRLDHAARPLADRAARAHGRRHWAAAHA